MAEQKEAAIVHFKSDYFRTLFDAICELEHETAARQVLAGFEDFDDTVPPDTRAKMIELLVQRMETAIPSDERRQRIRERCSCKPAEFLEKAKQLRKSASDMHAFVSELQKTGFAGNPLTMEGNTIHGVFGYKRCLCPWPGDTKGHGTLTWCHCCQGHLKWLYENALEQNVDVDLYETVLTGADDCRYRLTLASHMEKP
jgi:hypothetical protein